MEIGVAQSLETPFGEFVFNDFSGHPTSVSGVVGDVLYPGIPVFPNIVGAGVIIQKITGMSGGGVRNPVTVKPHKGGAIVHKFQRTVRLPTIQGVIIANNSSDRQAVVDQLLGCVDTMVSNDARWVFAPPGVATGKRFLTVRLYDECDVAEGNGGVSGPKEVTIPMAAGDWRTYTYTQDRIDIAIGATVHIPNDGNTETWPLVRIYGPIVSPVEISRSDGYAINLNTAIAAGHWATINMLEETIYMDDSGANLLSSMDMTLSDFFSIRPGGEDIGLSAGAGSTGHATVSSNDAWV